MVEELRADGSEISSGDGLLLLRTIILCSWEFELVAIFRNIVVTHTYVILSNKKEELKK